MRDAVVAGVVVLVLAAALFLDVIYEYLRGQEDHDYDRERHSSLMREIRRYDES